MSDAAAEVRSEARACYWKFAGHFKEEADYIMGQLDSSAQKQLIKEMSSPPVARKGSLSPSKTPESEGKDKVRRNLFASPPKQAISPKSITDTGNWRLYSGDNLLSY
jgi:hypothetical protein